MGKRLSQVEKWRTGFRIFFKEEFKKNFDKKFKENFDKEFKENFDKESKKDVTGVIEIIGILEKLNNYNYEKDTLGTEREKAKRIRELINSLKGE